MKQDSQSVRDAPAALEILDLARSGSAAAVEKLSQYAPGQLVDAVVSLPAAKRAALLELLDRVDEVVPLLPETEFTTIVRAAGIEDAGWLVEFASGEQRVAAVDLDCWKDLRLSPSRLFEWIDAMIEAGPETLLSAFDELDLELWVVAMKEMADFSVGRGEDSDLMTDDGIVFYNPHSAEHEDRIHAILDVARDESPRHYWGFVYGAMLGSQHESEQYAARWQRGRLNDLGFPDREHAMAAYQPLRPERVHLPPDDLGDQGNRSLVLLSQPPAMLGGSLLGLGLSGLAPDRASEVLGYVLGVANSLAVADELDLANNESTRSSLEKALRGIERGLEELTQRHDRSASEILDRVTPMELFRIGATLEPELNRAKDFSSFQRREDLEDWNVETEALDPEDQTIGSDGRLR